MAQHLKPRIVTDQLALNFDGNGGGKGANKYVSPNSLSARCIMWLDAADESTIIHSSNAVTDWLDKSSAAEFGGASNATDADTSNHRPTYNKKSLNGLGGISFDGSNNELLAPFHSNNYVADNAANDVIIVFRALSTNSSDNTKYIFDGDTDNDADARRLLKHESSSSGMNWHAGASASTGTDGDLNGLDPHIVSVRFADSGLLWNNGLKVGGSSDVLTSAVAHKGIVLGADYNHERNSNIEIFEVMVFQSTLTNEERQQMEFYLSHKWDIPLQISHNDSAAIRSPIDSAGNATNHTSSIDYLFPALNAKRGIFIGNEAGRSITYTTNSKISDLNANGGYTIEWAAAMICCQADSGRTGGTNYALIANETYQSNGFVLRYGGSNYGRPYWRENHGSGTSTFDDLRVDSAHRTVAGEWAHWHGVYDGGSTFTWYKNGVEIQSNTGNFEGITATSNNLQFLAQSSQCFVGELAFLRLYQKSLTHGEIMQNYNATKSRINAIPKIPAPKNAVLYVDASGSARTRAYASATFFDLGPNEIDGTVEGASQASTNVSNLPKHYDFDGTNDYINFQNTSHTQFAHDDNFSLLVWFKPDAISGFKHLIGKTYGNYRLAHNNATLSFRLDENNLIAASGNVLSAGTWYCAIATYDASTKIALVYLDGVQVASQQNTNVDWTNTNANFQLGNSSGESYYFDGKIATAMVYDITLSQDQVTEAYNYFKNRFGKA
tara:strand:+ start:1567 stop:3735 length:2169 start_codon:yes stop_codon:yes gene_type:complete